MLHPRPFQQSATRALAQDASLLLLEQKAGQISRQDGAPRVSCASRVLALVVPVDVTEDSVVG
jgi:hypothetical protein